MKTKKILFTTAGVLKCVVGGCVLAFFLLMLLLSGVVKEAIIKNGDLLEKMIEEMVQEDPGMAHLLEMSNQEIADYLMGSVVTFAIIMSLMGATSITLGVFTLIFAKKYDIMLRANVKRKVIFTVLDYLFYIGLIAKILTSVALFIKDPPLEEISNQK